MIEYIVTDQVVIPPPHIALIDIDQIAYACAILGDKSEEPDSHILHTAKLMLEARIKEAKTLCPSIKVIHLFISDKNNFRKWKDPEYKANRPPKPKSIKMVRKYLMKKGAETRPFLEADDVTAMNHWASWENETYKTVIVDQDKDLDQIPGHRIVPSLKRGGEIVREAAYKFITPEDATFSFYKQLLTGDVSDNISGVWGKPTNKNATAEKLLEGCNTAYEMWERVLNIYLEHFEDWPDTIRYVTLNANHLYMKRFPNDYFLPPSKPKT